MIYTRPAAPRATRRPNRPARIERPGTPGAARASRASAGHLFVRTRRRGSPPWQRSTASKAAQTLTVGDKTYTYYSLLEAEKNGLPGISQLPFSMKVLLENLLRFEDGRTVTKADIEAVAAWLDNKGKAEKEIAFRPARVLMQDFTGVPAVVDLAAMRDAMKKLGGDPRKINPLVPVDLVIDHSVIVDEFGTPQGLRQERRARIRSATASATGS